MQLPSNLLSYWQGRMFDFQEKKPMRDVQHVSISSLIFDWRTAQQKTDAKYNNQTATLNHKELDVLTQRPAFVHQQTSKGDFSPQLLYFELQNIILRTNELNEETMTVSLLSSSLPFYQLQ